MQRYYLKCLVQGPTYDEFSIKGSKCDDDDNNDDDDESR